MKNAPFQNLVRALRAGDPRAAEELVREYEPLIRRVVRLRLTDPRLRRAFDSVDVCQSILAQFFERTVRGQFDLSTPEGLRKLLVKMALHKFVDKARHEQYHAGGLPDAWEPADAGPTPPERALQQDLLQAIRGRLTEKERALLDQRAEGHSWEEIARGTGQSADALRMTHARLVARIRQELKHEEANRAR
jgi:RNA polymerase sigma-70 factor (ECF subfamily)